MTLKTRAMPGKRKKAFRQCFIRSARNGLESLSTAGAQVT
jgi:hypothetical protein